MAKVFCTFGPGDTYLFYGPTQFCGNDLPDAVGQILNQKNLKSAHHASFGDSGAFYISYELSGDSGATSNRIAYAGLPYALSEWIGSPAFPKRDISSLKVTLGPNGSALAWDKDSVFRCRLPLGLEKFLDESTSSPLYASLGYEGSYFIVRTEEIVSWSFPDQASELCISLEEFKKTGELAQLAYASISPFDPDRCIVILKNNRCLACVPDEWKEPCNEVAQGFLGVVQAASESAKEAPNWKTSGSKTVVFKEASSPSDPYVREIDFAFGPNDSYLYHSASRWVSQGLPVLIKKRMDNGMPLFNINQIALAPDRGFFYTYSPDGEAATAFDQYLLPPKLETYLHENWLHTSSLRIVLGPWPSFFVIDENHYHYDSIPQGLVADLDGLPDPAADPPEIIALGPGGSYFLRSKLGTYAYSLLGCDPEIDAAFDAICYVEGHPAGLPGAFDDLIYMSVSPYTPGRFIGVFDDGRVVGTVPPAWREACDTVTATIQEHFLQKQREVQAQQQQQQRELEAQQQYKAAPIVAKVSPLPKPLVYAIPAPAVVPARRAVPRGQHGSNFGTWLKTGVKILNAVNRIENAANGGGGVYVADTNTTVDATGMDMSSFWQPLSDAASDPIQ